MPILIVDTNVDLDKDAAVSAAKMLSARTGQLLGKGEAYVQAEVNGGRALVMGGTDDPVVYAVLQSVGLADDACPGLSRELCKVFESILGVPPQRSYILFEDLSRSRVGWDSKTLG